MQQNGQEQQERSRLQQPVEQPEREGEPNSALISAQGEQRLPAEQLKTEECLDLLRRTQADFVNYRRRMSQEQAEGRIAAQIALLSRLLPVLDDLGRALGAVPPATGHAPRGAWPVAGGAQTHDAARPTGRATDWHTRRAVRSAPA
jgi:molecular chaperone GrpE